MTPEDVALRDRNRLRALERLIRAVREELTDEKVTYTIGERSITYYGEGFGKLIAAAIEAEIALGWR